MRVPTVVVVFALLATPALAQEEQPPSLSEQDMARLTVAVSQEFDLLETRLLQRLDRELAVQDATLANLTEQVAHLRQATAASEAEETAHWTSLELRLNATHEAIANLSQQQGSVVQNQTVQLQQDIQNARTDIAPVLNGLAALAEQQATQEAQLASLQAETERAEDHLRLAVAALALLLFLLWRRTGRSDSPSSFARLRDRIKEHHHKRRITREQARADWDSHVEAKKLSADEAAALVRGEPKRRPSEDLWPRTQASPASASAPSDTEARSDSDSDPEEPSPSSDPSPSMNPPKTAKPGKGSTADPSGGTGTDASDSSTDFDVEEVLAPSIQ